MVLCIGSMVLWIGFMVLWLFVIFVTSFRGPWWPGSGDGKCGVPPQARGSAMSQLFILLPPNKQTRPGTTGIIGPCPGSLYICAGTQSRPKTAGCWVPCSAGSLYIWAGKVCSTSSAQLATTCVEELQWRGAGGGGGGEEGQLFSVIKKQLLFTFKASARPGGWLLQSE